MCPDGGCVDGCAGVWPDVQGCVPGCVGVGAWMCRGVWPGVQGCVPG